MNAPATPHPLPGGAWMRGLFYAAAFVFSALVYGIIYRYVWRFASYPIELEWREGTMWLHALALSNGVNIFKNEEIVYVNANHGIFDHIVKGMFVRSFPFLEPQYILRSFVLLFPAISLWSAFVQSRKSLPTIEALISSICLCSAMLISAYDIGHWYTCVGRSDATALTLIVIACLCYAPDTSTPKARLLRHLSCLALALVFSTNWRIYPIAFLLPVIMEQRHDTVRIRELIRIYLSIGGYTLGTCAFFILAWFHADLLSYYRYFFGFFSSTSPWPTSPASYHTIIISVRTPAVPVMMIFSVVPVFVEAWRHFLKRSGNWPQTLGAITIFVSLLVSILALRKNLLSGGYYYLVPQVILLAIYYNTRYKIRPWAALAILALGLCVLGRSHNLGLMEWYYRNLRESLPAARNYAGKMVLLDRTFGVYSEEAFLFKRSKPLPPIDMGDAAEALAKANYVSPRRTAVFQEQKSKILSHEPVLVFSGGWASSAVKQLTENEEYYPLLNSPTVHIGGKVYVRVDHLEEVQRFLADHAPTPP